MLRKILITLLALVSTVATIIALIYSEENPSNTMAYLAQLGFFYVCFIPVLALFLILYRKAIFNLYEKILILFCTPIPTYLIWYLAMTLKGA
jgi:CDP-diglyceride synthetase